MWIEYCCHIIPPAMYHDILDKIQRRVSNVKPGISTSVIHHHYSFPLFSIKNFMTKSFPPWYLDYINLSLLLDWQLSHGSTIEIARCNRQFNSNTSFSSGNLFRVLVSIQSTNFKKWKATSFTISSLHWLLFFTVLYPQ